MPEETDLEELTPLRVAAVRSVQDKSDSVEDMLDKADKVVAYYMTGVPSGTTVTSGGAEEDSSQPL